MANDLSARVAREKEAYNQGLRRGLYTRIFRHADFLYRQQRQTIIARTMQAAQGKRVLELGSTAWTRFVDEVGVTPAELVCINISERELDKGRERAHTARLKPDFRVMDAHALEFPDGYFDVVFGVAILHHLDLEKALAEVRRVLRPGGLMLFAEPLDNNPVGWLVRSLTPAARTADERPFRRAELALVQERFHCRPYFEQFLSVPLGMLSGLLFRAPDNPLTRFALRLDETLLARSPALGPYFRHVLIVGERPAVPA